MIMKTLKKVLLTFMLFIIGLTSLSVFSIASAQWNDPYKPVLNTTVQNIRAPLADPADVVTDGRWASLFNEQILILVKYIIYVLIVVWIAVAFFWGYKVMTSSKEEDMKEWLKLVGFGILWIIIMVSAQFLASSLVWDGGIITEEFVRIDGDSPNWIALAENLYKKIMFPFIKIVLYLVVWALFIMMAIKVISYVVSTDDIAKKKALWAILWCVIWIFIVMAAKQVVEAIMWKQTDVINRAAITISWWEAWEWWMWNKIMEFGSIPLIAQIINWAMWLTMFVLLVLIVLQWYKMFAKPDDPKNRENIKKTLLYIVIWVLVIGAAYVISNVLVIDRLPIE